MIDQHETPLLRLPGPWGIPIDITPSFVMLVVLLVLASSAPILESLIFVGLIALSILLHEIGHAWGCIIQRVQVHKIVLWGAGGYCSHRLVRDPVKNELIVAMGPIVNLALWALAGLALPSVSGEGAFWLDVFGQINLVLFVLNMIPVQPLDGGRLFHLVLLRIMPPRTALQVAGGVGLVCAILWVPALLVAYLWFGLLLLFLPSIPIHWHMMRGRVA